MNVFLSTGGAPEPPVDRAVRRLVLVSTAYCRRDQRFLAQHGGLLGVLLDPDAPGQGWLAHLDRDDRAARPRSVTRRREAVEDETRRDPARWYSGGDDTGEFFADLRTACLDSSEPRHQLEGFRHRLYVDAARFVAATGWQDGVPAEDFVVVLDLRFCQLGREPVCQVTFSVWSGPPWSDHHRPPVAAARAACGSLLGRGLDLVFEVVRRHAEALIDCYFTVVPLGTASRPSRAPIFWTLVPDDDIDDPLEFLDHRGRVAVAHAARRLLGVADSRDTDVACSVLHGDVLVLRKTTVGDDGRDVPTYLLLPARPGGADARSGRGGPVTDSFGVVEQEDTIRRMITKLSDLEALVAARSGELEADTESWDAQLYAYENALVRVGRIWEGLASHLLVERRGVLARLYRSVALLHQTLIQTVPEIDRLLTVVRRRAEYLERSVDEMAAHATGDLAEVAGDAGTHEPISRALSASASTGDIRRRLAELQLRASRLADNQHSLLITVGHAYNERRMRENDVLQKSGALLAALVVFVGLLTAGGASGAVTVDIGVTGWPSSVVAPAARLLLGAAAVWWVVCYLRIGTLGGIRYRFVYRRLWNLMRQVSSGHLEPVAEGIEREPDDRRSRHWARLDADLAAELARVWDLIDMLPGDERVVQPPLRPILGPLGRFRELRRAVRADRRQLRRMVEKWSLRTLLFTQRPRDLRSYELVRLTAMYRAVFPLMGREGHVVSGSDVAAVLCRYPRPGMRRSIVPGVLDWVDLEAERILAEWLAHPTPGERRPAHSSRCRTVLDAVCDLSRLWRCASSSGGHGRGTRMLAVLDWVGLSGDLGVPVDGTVPAMRARSSLLARISGRAAHGRGTARCDAGR